MRRAGLGSCKCSADVTKLNCPQAKVRFFFEIYHHKPARTSERETVAGVLLDAASLNYSAYKSQSSPNDLANGFWSIKEVIFLSCPYKTLFCVPVCMIAS